jgi:microcystin-dependent protein
MATNFPTSLDTLSNPSSGSALNSPSHSSQHADANDAIEALQAKVGVNSSAVTTSLDYKVGVNSPPGMVIQYAGSSAPTGWLLCDGSTVSRTTYAALFAIVGTTYGSGDGSTTFTLPNLKGRVPVGRDAGQTEFDVLGETGGAKTHTLTTSEMPSHTHTQNAHNHGVTDPTHRHKQATRWLNGVQGAFNIFVYVSNVNSSFPEEIYTDYSSTGISVNNQTATNQNTGGGGAHNNLQPYIVLNYLIKT